LISTDVVIVDDEEDILELLEYKFQQNGIVAKGFISLNSAMEYIFANDIKAVVIDKDDVPQEDIKKFEAKLKKFGYEILFFYITDNNIDEIIRALSS